MATDATNEGSYEPRPRGCAAPGSEPAPALARIVRPRRVERSRPRPADAFDGLAAPAGVVDADGRLLQCNKALAALLGTPPGHRRNGRSLAALLDARYHLADTAPLVALRDDRRPRAVLLRLGDRALRAHLAPLAHGGSTCLLVDVTEEQSLAEEVARGDRERAESERRRDDLLATLAHELRNPLGAIRFALHLLEREPGDRAAASAAGAETRGDRAARLQATCVRQVAHLSRLLDELIDLSRLNHDTLELRREEIDLGAVVERAAVASRPLMEARGHRFTVTVEDTPFVARADPMRLEQMVTNLLDNAARYTAPGGAITLAVERDAEGAAIRVRDNGQGIAREHMDRLFEPFARAAGGHAQATAGLGVGLSLVKRLAELHGGSVLARSDGPGCGSEFTLQLPLLEGPMPCRPAAPRPAAGRAFPLDIVVIDDNEDGRETLREVLELGGHRVRTASDGREGLRQLLDRPPDLALVDIGLPGLDGYQVARGLRAAPGGDRPLLVAVTGYGQPRDRERARAAGFDVHLVKPVAPRCLYAVVERARARAAAEVFDEVTSIDLVPGR